MLRSINVQREGFRSEESKIVILNGGIPQVFFTPPFLVVQYKLTRIQEAEILVASLVEKHERYREGTHHTGQYYGFLVFHICRRYLGLFSISPKCMWLLQLLGSQFFAIKMCGI